MELIRWHHATNSSAKIENAIVDIQTDRVDNCIIGVECDLRFDEAEGLVLSHDAVVPGSHPIQAALAIEMIVRAASSASKTTVLKLDCKDSAALRAVSLLDIWLTPRANISVWSNADLVPCDSTDYAQFSAAFPDPIASGTDLLRLGDVISIGFFRAVTDLRPYHAEDARRLETFVKDLFAASPKRVAVTFALRLSVVQMADSLPAVRSMLSRVTSLGAPSCFLTLWRSRTEVISDGDLIWVAEHFPTATVDRD